MIRLLLFLFGKQSYEPCKGCETLKQQLMLANEEKKELTSTLLSLLKPRVSEAVPTEIGPIQPQVSMFSRRRAALEQRDRETARIKQNSESLGKPDSIAKLEQELGIDAEGGKEEGGV